MQIVDFPEKNTVFAVDQPEYLPLPAHRFQNDAQGRIVCCWKLSAKELKQVKKTGVIWHEILTFNQPLQPQLLRVDKPEFK